MTFKFISSTNFTKQVRCKMSGTLLLMQLAKKHKQASLDTETMLEPKGSSLFQLIMSDLSP